MPETRCPSQQGGEGGKEARTRAPTPQPTAVTPHTLNTTTLTRASRPATREGQKVDTRLRDTTVRVEGSLTTAASLPHQDATHRGRRRRSPGANRTCASAAAHGAVGAHRPALSPEIEVPAKLSPHTLDRTTPGRGTVQTALTQTLELDAAHEVIHPFAKEEETPPASWRHAGSPVLENVPSRTTVPVHPHPAMTAVRPDQVTAAVGATAATVAAAVGAGATVAAGAGAGVDLAVITATAATTAQTSEEKLNALNAVIQGDGG